MNAKEKLDLIKQNTEEIILESELKELLKKRKQPVCYCGYEPSGALHMGHLSTLVKLIDMRRAGFKVIVLLADLHALVNRKGTPEFIAEQVRIWKKAIKAFGLDCEFSVGSKFQFKKEYWENVIRMSLKTTVKRGLRSMQELARDFDHATISQMLYPLMQAEDIHALNCDVAVGAIEQRKVHMIARELFPKLGLRAPICVHTPMIDSLQGPGKKMSSSVPLSLVAVTDSEKDVKNKINKAFCPAKQVEGNPVLQITRLIVFPLTNKINILRPAKFGGNISFDSYEALEKAFANGKLHPADLKAAVASELNKMLKPVRTKFKRR